ncbi:MAG: hypothetical protein ACMUIS_11945 [bacterium]
MKKKGFKKLILDVLDREATPEAKRLLEEKCRENKALAEEKASFERTVSLLKGSPAVQPPDGFTERVMARIEEKRMGVEQKALHRVASLMDLRLNPVWKWSLVFSLVVLITAGATWQYLQLHRARLQVDQLKQQIADLENQPIPTRFVFYRSMAKSVHLAGNFNDWEIDEQFRLVNTGGGPVWSITLMLKPGQYEYMFVVDQSEWVTDPGAVASRSDGFGHRNSIVEVIREI